MKPWGDVLVLTFAGCVVGGLAGLSTLLCVGAIAWMAEESWGAILKNLGWVGEADRLRTLGIYIPALTIASWVSLFVVRRLRYASVGVKPGVQWVASFGWSWALMLPMVVWDRWVSDLQVAQRMLFGASWLLVWNLFWGWDLVSWKSDAFRGGRAGHDPDRTGT